MTRLPIMTLAVALLCALSACSTRSAEPTARARIELPELPANLQNCEGPAPIGYDRVQSGYMPPKAMLDGWATDRKRLADCAGKHAVVVNYYDDLRSKLQ